MSDAFEEAGSPNRDRLKKFEDQWCINVSQQIHALISPAVTEKLNIDQLSVAFAQARYRMAQAASDLDNRQKRMRSDLGREFEPLQNSQLFLRDMMKEIDRRESNARASMK